jgi:hypothetical protein
MRFPVVVPDCLGNTIKEPLLRSVIDSCSLHHNVIGSYTFSNSSKWKFGHNIEWSIDMETKVFRDSFSLWTLSFVKIDNIPLLVLSSVVTPNSNWMSFLVFALFNVKNLVVVPVHELVVLILENLVPS